MSSYRKMVNELLYLSLFSSAVKSTVSSPGWLVGRKGEEIPRMRPRMRAMSFQAEEGREGLDQEEEQEERVDEYFKEAQTFPPMEIKPVEGGEEFAPEKMSEREGEERRLSAGVGQEEEVEEKVDGQLKDDDIITPEQISPGGNETGWTEEVEEEEEREYKSGTNSSTTNSSFIDPGSAANASTAVISVSHICPDGGDEMSCTDTDGTSTSAAHGPTDSPDISALFNVKASSGTSGSGSAQVLETLAGTQSSTSESEFDPPGFLDVRKSGQSRVESEELDLLFRSEPFKFLQKSVDTRMRGQEDGDDPDPDPAADVHDDNYMMLHSPQIRRLELDQSSHPAGLWDLVSGAESGSDSGVEEGEALRMSPFTGAAKTHRAGAQGSSQWTMMRPHDVRPEHHERTIHSAVVTATSTLQDSGSSLVFDGEWAEVEPGERSGFVVWSSDTN